MRINLDVRQVIKMLTDVIRVFAGFLSGLVSLVIRPGMANLTIKDQTLPSPA